MHELLMPIGTPETALHYEPRIDELAAEIGPDAILDAAKWNSNTWGNGSTAPNYPQPYAEAVAELRDSYLPERRRQLFNRLTSGASELPAQQPAGTTVLFGDINGGLTSRNQDEEYIQLVNPNSLAVDISGWVLGIASAPDAPLFTFRGGTVIPVNGALYVAASRTAFRARTAFPTGGLGLFVVGDYAGRLSRDKILTLTNRQGLLVASTSIRRSHPSAGISSWKITPHGVTTNAACRVAPRENSSAR